ncbi:hypothetical protein pb186bvf_011405 [Paramecium bursaria]
MIYTNKQKNTHQSYKLIKYFFLRQNCSTQKMHKFYLVALMFTSGSLANISFQAQNSIIQYVNEDDTYGKFNHPFMQSFTMFIAELLSLIPFIIYQRSKEYEIQKMEASHLMKKRASFIYMLPTASMDLFSSTCIYISLFFISPAILTILQSSIIVTTALMQRIILKTILKNYQILGGFMIIFGIGICALANFIFPEDQQAVDKDYKGQVIAMILLLIAFLMYGVQFNIEEKLLNKYFLHPLELVGFEGFWGSILQTIVCILLSTFQCPQFLQDNCIYYKGGYYLERMDFYFLQIINNNYLLVYVLSSILIMPVFNVSSQSVTKYLTCIMRSVVLASLIMGTWLISITITLVSDYKWENTRWEAISILLIGFVFIVLGNLTYNGLWNQNNNQILVNQSESGEE